MKECKDCIHEIRCLTCNEHLNNWNDAFGNLINFEKRLNELRKEHSELQSKIDKMIQEQKRIEEDYESNNRE